MNQTRQFDSMSTLERTLLLFRMIFPRIVLPISIILHFVTGRRRRVDSIDTTDNAEHEQGDDGQDDKHVHVPAVQDGVVNPDARKDEDAYCARQGRHDWPPPESHRRIRSVGVLHLAATIVLVQMSEIGIGAANGERRPAVGAYQSLLVVIIVFLLHRHFL